MKTLFTLISLIIMSSAVLAQDMMTPELLWKLKRIGGVQISPDGEQIMYSVREYILEENRSVSDLYLMPVKGGKAKRLTNTEGHELDAQWRPDGKKIAYLAKTDKGYNIFEMNPDGSGAEQISFIEGGVDGFKYSPNMKKMLFLKEVQVTKHNSKELHSDLPESNARVYDDLMYRHWDTWEDGYRSHIFFAEIKDGKVDGQGEDILRALPYDAPLKPFGGMEQICWSPDDVNIIYTAKKKKGMRYAISTNSDLYMYNTLLGNDNNMTKPYTGYDMNPQYSPDGKKIAWLSMEQDGFEADKNDIMIYDFANHQVTNLTKRYDITVSDFCWNGDGTKIYFLSCVEATFQLFELDVNSVKYRQITEGDHNYTSVAFAGDVLIAGRQDMNHATEIYSVDIKKGTQKQMTDVNGDIYGKLKTSKIEKRWVNTTDGKKELVWVIYPPDFDPAKKYPALLYCQGGPQSAVSQFYSYRWNFQLMAANGYIVVAPNRRGLPSFGQKWNDAISGDWGGQPMDDYLSAIDSLKKEPFIDENKIGAVGASYGGYSVYYLAGIHQKRFKCFISHCGLYNLESWYGTTEELFFANQDIGGAYYFDMKKPLYEKNSPHKKVGDWDTPMLIFHGEKDYRVPLNQGMEAFQACQILGIESRLITFPDENHWVLSPQNGVFWHREYYSWLDKYLKN